jgi:hypothetical protein
VKKLVIKGKNFKKHLVKNILKIRMASNIIENNARPQWSTIFKYGKIHKKKII